MATLHHTVTALPSRSARSSPSAPRRATLVAGLVAAALLSTPTAAAAPGRTVAGAQSAHDAAAAEVAAIAARVTAAEETLQRMTIEAEAASGEALAAQAALAAAQAEAQATAAELAAAAAPSARRRGRGLRPSAARPTWAATTLRRRRRSSWTPTAPTELLQQAATLEVLGEERSRAARGAWRTSRRGRPAPTRAARAAVAERDRLAGAAAEAEAAANAQLAAAQGTFDAVAAEKAALDAQLREAEIRLLPLQGAQRRRGAPGRPQEAAAAAPTRSPPPAAPSRPTTGRVTSCYGARWGTLHAGVDIAAPIGTPVYAPEGGVVLQAGPASGFGLAVAVQHGDGTITLYGHVNQMLRVRRAGRDRRPADRRGRQPRPVDRPAPALRGAHRRAVREPRSTRCRG